MALELEVKIWINIANYRIAALKKVSVKHLSTLELCVLDSPVDQLFTITLLNHKPLANTCNHTTLYIAFSKQNKLNIALF